MVKLLLVAPSVSSAPLCTADCRGAPRGAFQKKDDPEMAVGVRQEVDMAHSGTVYAFSLHTAYCRTLYTLWGTYGPSSLVKNPVNAKGTRPSS